MYVLTIAQKSRSNSLFVENQQKFQRVITDDQYPFIVCLKFLKKIDLVQFEMWFRECPKYRPNQNKTKRNKNKIK